MDLKPRHLNHKYLKGLFSISSFRSYVFYRKPSREGLSKLFLCSITKVHGSRGPPLRQEAATTPGSVLELHSIQPTNCRCKAGVKRFAIIVKVKQRRGEHSTVVVVVLMVQYP